MECINFFFASFIKYCMHNRSSIVRLIFMVDSLEFQNSFEVQTSLCIRLRNRILIGTKMCNYNLTFALSYISTPNIKYRKKSGHPTPFRIRVLPANLE